MLTVWFKLASKLEELRADSKIVLPIDSIYLQNTGFGPPPGLGYTYLMKARRAAVWITPDAIRGRAV